MIWARWPTAQRRCSCNDNDSCSVALKLRARAILRARRGARHEATHHVVDQQVNGNLLGDHAW